MKIFILSPSTDLLLTPDLRTKLSAAGEIIYVTEIKPFQKVTELFAGNEDRILAIDPDFCNWKIPDSLMDQIPSLKAICLQTTSFSWINLEYAKQKNIPVLNVRNWSTYSVAEWAVMMDLNRARRVPLIIKDQWGKDFSKHQGMELKGKTAGIIGLGHIGKRIAEICQGLGMSVVYWSKHSRDECFSYQELNQLLSTSDFIFPALASNPETKNLITDTMIKTLKKTAIFTSITHPTNHELLLEMVEKGQLFGYGFEEESGKTFVEYKGNIWAGPALAWCTQEAGRRNAEQWVDNIVNATQGILKTKVN